MCELFLFESLEFLNLQIVFALDSVKILFLLAQILMFKFLQFFFILCFFQLSGHL